MEVLASTGQIDKEDLAEGGSRFAATNQKDRVVNASGE